MGEATPAALRVRWEDILARTDHSEHLDAVGEDLVQDPESLLDDLAKVLHLELRDRASGAREIGDLISASDDGICKPQCRFL